MDTFDREWTSMLKTAMEGGPDVTHEHPTADPVKEMLKEFKLFREAWNEERLRDIFRSEHAKARKQCANEIKEELKQSLEDGISIDRIADKAANSRSVQVAKWAIGGALSMILAWLGYTWNMAEKLDNQYVELKRVPQEMQDVRIQLNTQSAKIDQILARVHKSNVP